MPLCLKVCKLGCGSIEAPSSGEPKPGPLGPDFYYLYSQGFLPSVVWILCVAQAAFHSALLIVFTTWPMAFQAGTCFF